jgi:hypothetical protein
MLQHMNALKFHYNSNHVSETNAGANPFTHLSITIEKYFKGKFAIYSTKNPHKYFKRDSE